MVGGWPGGTRRKESVATKHGYFAEHRTLMKRPRARGTQEEEKQSRNRRTLVAAFTVALCITTLLVQLYAGKTEGVILQGAEQTFGNAKLALDAGTQPIPARTSPSETTAANANTHPKLFTSAKPTSSPSGKPTMYPSAKPTSSPSGKPTMYPSAEPTSSPSRKPTMYPSPEPTLYPSAQPTLYPSAMPTLSPTDDTPDPSTAATVYPSPAQSMSFTPNPTKLPTLQPTRYPSLRPTPFPSRKPTRFPSAKPTLFPTKMPVEPTPRPTSNWIGNRLAAIRTEGELPCTKHLEEIATSLDNLLGNRERAPIIIGGEGDSGTRAVADLFSIAFDTDLGQRTRWAKDTYAFKTTFPILGCGKDEGNMLAIIQESRLCDGREENMRRSQAVWENQFSEYRKKPQGEEAVMLSACDVYGHFGFNSQNNVGTFHYSRDTMTGPQWWAGMEWLISMFRAHAAGLSKSHIDGALWGLKQPRTAGMLPFFKAFLQEDFRFVLVIRDPRDVPEVDSLLSKRSPFATECRFLRGDSPLCDEVTLENVIGFRAEWNSRVIDWLRENLGPEQYIVVRIEDLVKRDLGPFERVSRWLDKSFHKSEKTPSKGSNRPKPRADRLQTLAKMYASHRGSYFGNKYGAQVRSGHNAAAYSSPFTVSYLRRYGYKVGSVGESWETESAWTCDTPTCP